MSRKKIATLLAGTLTALLFCFCSTPQAEAGNSWRWSKPLNHKAGHAFYTTNRAFKKKSTRSSSYHFRKYHNPHFRTFHNPHFHKHHTPWKTTVPYHFFRRR